MLSNLKYTNYIGGKPDNNNIFSDSNKVSFDINIFNPNNIDYPYLVNEIKEYWNYKYKFYQFYQEYYKVLISLFERLSFKDKKHTLAELFLILEHDELLPDNINGYEIARKIIKY